MHLAEYMVQSLKRGLSRRACPHSGGRGMKVMCDSSNSNVTGESGWGVPPRRQVVGAITLK